MVVMCCCIVLVEDYTSSDMRNDAHVSNDVRTNIQLFPYVQPGKVSHSLHLLANRPQKIFYENSTINT